MSVKRVFWACLIGAVVVVVVLLFAFGGDIGSLRIVVLEGRSMEPVSYDNDRAICLKRFALKPGANYLVRYEGELLFKHLRDTDREGCHFVSLNKGNDYLEFYSPQNDVVAQAVLVIPWHWVATTREEEPAKMAFPTDQEKLEDRVRRTSSRLEQKRELTKQGAIFLSLPSQARDLDLETGLEFPDKTWEMVFPKNMIGGISVTLSSTPRDMIPPEVRICISSGGNWKELGLLGGGSHELLLNPPIHSDRLRLEHTKGDPPILNEIYLLSG